MSTQAMTETVQLSGATIKLGTNFCYKFAYRRDIIDRLYTQAQYMTELNGSSLQPICPKVIDTTNHGYRMQRARTVHEVKGRIISAEDQSRLLEAMFLRLQDQVWSRPRIIAPNENWLEHLISYMTPVFAHSSVGIATVDRKTIENAIPDLGKMDLPSVRVHGDATLDNILFGKSSEGTRLLFVSDPLSPDKRIPAMRAVDLGKMLQSAHGWEHLKYGESWAKPSAQGVIRLMNMIPSGERYASAIWFGIHIARIVPYIGPSKIEILKPLARAAAKLIRAYR